MKEPHLSRYFVDPYKMLTTKNKDDLQPHALEHIGGLLKCIRRRLEYSREWLWRSGIIQFSCHCFKKRRSEESNKSKS